MPWLEKNLPFIGTIISSLVMGGVVALIEAKFALWALPIAILLVVLGNTGWAISASILLSLAVSLNSQQIQVAIGQNYILARDAVILTMIALSLLQIIVYVLNKSRRPAENVGAVTGRNAIFAIAGISLLYAVLYYLFGSFEIPAGFDLEGIEDYPILSAWIAVVFGLTSYVIEPVQGIQQSSDLAQIAYMISTACCRLSIFMPLTWASIFASFSQMLASRYGLRGLIIQAIKSLIAMLFIGGTLSYVIQLPLFAVIWFMESVFDQMPAFSTGSNTLVQNIVIVAMTSILIVSNALSAGWGASWGTASYSRKPVN